jgi:ZIP family zinc transporter
VFASSSLLVGAAIALQLRLGDRILGLVMAFGAGVLFSAVAYELFLEASEIVENRRWIAAGSSPARWRSFSATW